MRGSFLPIVAFLLLFYWAAKNRDITSDQAETIGAAYLAVVIVAILTKSFLLFAFGSIAMMIPILYCMDALNVRLR